MFDAEGYAMIHAASGIAMNRVASGEVGHWILQIDQWKGRDSDAWLSPCGINYQWWIQKPIFYMGLSLDIPIFIYPLDLFEMVYHDPKIPKSVGSWGCILSLQPYGIKFNQWFSKKNGTPVVSKAVLFWLLVSLCQYCCWNWLMLVLTPIACLPIFYNVFTYFYCIQTFQRKKHDWPYYHPLMAFLYFYSIMDSIFPTVKCIWGICQESIPMIFSIRIGGWASSYSSCVWHGRQVAVFFAQSHLLRCTSRLESGWLISI